MGGLRGKNHRFLRARPVAAYRVHVLVEIVEGRMGQPGLVEMQRVDFSIQHLLQRLHVVEHAVICALGDGQHSRFARLVLDERIRIDLALNAFRLEFAQGNRADDAEIVPRRRQKHRHSTGHHDGVQDGLVAIAVYHHDVIRCHGGMPDDFVGSGGAVGNEIQMIGIENTRRVALGSGYRPGMVEQLAQFVHRIAHVGAQHVLAEKLVEHASHRRFQESHATRMAGTVPGIRTILRVTHQRAEERRCQ